MIVASPTQQKILADFIGVEAHAGIRPEDGSSAIAAAAAAISRMELGRLDEETTANVGVIAGGTSGNVVPGHCGIDAEARSLDAGRAAEVAGQIADACAWGASEHGCDVDVRIEELFRGYRGAHVLAGAGAGRGGPAARRRSSRCGPRPAAAATPTPCAVDGFDCVLLANGTEAVHTADERVPAAQPRRRCSRSARAIVAEAAGDGAGVSGRLKLRRGVVVASEPLTVEVDGERAAGLGRRRRCWARCARATRSSSTSRRSTSALGSGGFDVVHVNLTRGLEGGARRATST